MTILYLDSSLSPPVIPRYALWASSALECRKLPSLRESQRSSLDPANFRASQKNNQNNFFGISTKIVHMHNLNEQSNVLSLRHSSHRYEIISLSIYLQSSANPWERRSSRSRVPPRSLKKSSRTPPRTMRRPRTARTRRPSSKGDWTGLHLECAQVD